MTLLDNRLHQLNYRRRPRSQFWNRWKQYFLLAPSVIGYLWLAVGSAGLSWQAIRKDVAEGRSPFFDLEAWAALPVLAFGALLLIVILKTTMRKLQEPSYEPLDPSDFDAGPDLAADGHEFLYLRIPRHELAFLREECDRLQLKEGRPRAGLRDPLKESRSLDNVERTMRVFARRLLGENALPVRSILFDKTPETNWDVVWHQDITIAVKERKDVDGFGPWSVKQGVPHVQPPASVLEKMVTLRLHLDDCPAENGPLLVVPGSHTRGFIDVRTLDTAECDRNAVACAVSAGDVVAMRPLLLHASKKSLAPSHRRVLHVEYACEPLPDGLEWA